MNRDLKWWITLTPEQRQAVYDDTANHAPSDVLHCMDSLHRVQLLIAPPDRLLKGSEKLQNVALVLQVQYYDEFIKYLRKQDKIRLGIANHNPYIQAFEKEGGLLYMFSADKVFEALHVLFYGRYKQSKTTVLMNRVTEALDAISGKEREKALAVLKRYGLKLADK